jgi:hypothetical protein
MKALIYSWQLPKLPPGVVIRQRDIVIANDSFLTKPSLLVPYMNHCKISAN